MTDYLMFSPTNYKVFELPREQGEAFWANGQRVTHANTTPKDFRLRMVRHVGERWSNLLVPLLRLGEVLQIANSDDVRWALGESPADPFWQAVRIWESLLGDSPVFVVRGEGQNSVRLMSRLRKDMDVSTTHLVWVHLRWPYSNVEDEGCLPDNGHWAIKNSAVFWRSVAVGRDSH